jgi:hypothetical protein
LQRRALRIVLALLAAGVVINAACIAWYAGAAYLHLTGLKAHASPSVAGAGIGGPTALGPVRASLRDLSADLAGVRRHAAPLLWLCPYLGWLPVHGADVAAAPQLLDLADHLTAAGLLLLDALAPMVEAAPEGHGGAIDRLTALLPALAGARPQLADADARLARAEEVWDQLAGEPLSAQLAQPLDRVGGYLPALRSGVQLAALAPFLLGAEGARTYLILAQNEDELRPTGGFISSAGLVTFDGGRITRLEFEDSYAVDDLNKPYPEPPEPLRRIMLADLWLFRDINWSPDFPTTARAAADAYTYGRGVVVDGVVAVDQQALQLLLAALGPVTVAATGETVTADGLIEAIRKHWAPEPGEGLTEEWWLQRKSFLGDLAAAMRDRLETNAGALDLPALARALHRALAGKHLLIQVWQPEVAAALSSAGWSGAVGAAEGDFLMVVDANVGFNKASAALTRRIDYHVTLEADGGGRAEATVQYYHTAAPTRRRCVPEVRYDEVYAQMIDRCLWNYVRLYVPPGAQLEDWPRLVVPADQMLSGEPTSGTVDIETTEANTTAFGLLFVLPTGESMALTYAYRLPAGLARRLESADSWRYALRLQKQPGTGSTPVQVTVTLPEGAAVLTSRPRADATTGRDLVFHLDLIQDRDVVVTYATAEMR